MADEKEDLTVLETFILLALAIGVLFARAYTIQLLWKWHVAALVPHAPPDGLQADFVFDHVVKARAAFDAVRAMGVKATWREQGEESSELALARARKVMRDSYERTKR